MCYGETKSMKKQWSNIPDSIHISNRRKHFQLSNITQTFNTYEIFLKKVPEDIILPTEKQTELKNHKKEF